MVKILLLITLFPAVIMAQNLYLENPLRILALGDSYTKGQSVPLEQRWPVQLSDSLNARGIITDTLRIIALTGWRTDNLINAISNQHLEDENYNLVSLLIGVNNQYQGRPFSQYISEFPALLDSAIRYAGGDPNRVFVVSIPDYAYTPFGQQGSNPDQISAEIDQYNDYNRHVADSMQVTYFDITPISRLGLQYPSYVANDGLHPSGIQYTEWVKLMLEFIDQELTGIHSVEPATKLAVELTPNPAANFIQIGIPGSENQEVYRIQLYTVTGKLVLEKRISERSCRISIAEFPEGLYFVKISSGQKLAVMKLVKKA